MSKPSFEVFLKEDNKELYYWLRNQQRRKLYLPPDRIEKLESLSNFHWNKEHNTRWQEHYRQCKKIIKETGKVAVS